MIYEAQLRLSYSLAISVRELQDKVFTFSLGSLALLTTDKTVNNDNK